MEEERILVDDGDEDQRESILAPEEFLQCELADIKQQIVKVKSNIKEAVAKMQYQDEKIECLQEQIVKVRFSTNVDDRTAGTKEAHLISQVFGRCEPVVSLSETSTDRSKNDSKEPPTDKTKCLLFPQHVVSIISGPKVYKAVGYFRACGETFPERRMA